MKAHARNAPGLRLWTGPRTAAPHRRHPQSQAQPWQLVLCQPPRDAWHRPQPPCQWAASTRWERCWPSAAGRWRRQDPAAAGEGQGLGIMGLERCSLGEQCSRGAGLLCRLGACSGLGNAVARHLRMPGRPRKLPVKAWIRGGTLNNVKQLPNHAQQLVPHWTVSCICCTKTSSTIKWQSSRPSGAHLEDPGQRVPGRVPGACSWIPKVHTNVHMAHPTLLTTLTSRHALNPTLSTACQLWINANCCSPGGKEWRRAWLYRQQLYCQ